MNDLISRRAAIDALDDMMIYRPLDSDRYVIRDCLNKIVNLPSAQKTGKWIEDDDRIIAGHCSLCGWNAIYDETDVFEMPYCPSCGARMESE